MKQHEKRRIKHDFVNSDGGAATFSGRTTVSAIPPWGIVNSIDVSVEPYGSDVTSSFADLIEVAKDNFIVNSGFSVRARYFPQRRTGGIYVYATYIEYLDILSDDVRNFQEVEFNAIGNKLYAYLEMPWNTDNIKAVRVTLPDRSEVTLNTQHVPSEQYSFIFQEETKRITLSRVN